MATLPILIFSLVFSLANSQSPSKPNAFNFPITKDSSVNQYYTPIQIGSNITTFNAVLDLGAKFLWFNSIDYFNAADTYRPIRCGTQQCRIAQGVGCVFCFLSPPVPGCTNNTCSDYALNPYSGTQGYTGLGSDTLHVQSTRGRPYIVKNFPFQFSDPALRVDLSNSVAGVVALGRTKIALQAQLASAYKIREKFALCLPSSGNEGNLIIGQTAYASPFDKFALFTTPLITNPVSTWPSDLYGNFSVEYFLGVQGIRIGNRALSLNKTLLSIDKKTGDGGSSIRTVRPYSSMHSSMYGGFVNEYVKAAALKNIKRVASVDPFGACFDAKTIGGTTTGPDVPTVDLVMSNNVYWRFYGSNTMVRVSDDVMCLAFVDGGTNRRGPATTIVVGGYQMENYLVEFDVASSKVRFSSALVMEGTSCSHFKAA